MMLMMKKLTGSLLLILTLSLSVPLLADDGNHGGGGGGGNGSNGNSGQDRVLKIFNYYNACMAGRPGLDVNSLDFGGGGGGTGGGSSGGGDGQSVFTSKCMGCHDGSSTAPSFSSLSSAQAQGALNRINLPPNDSKHMPQRGTLSAEEKSALEAFLRSKM